MVVAPLPALVGEAPNVHLEIAFVVRAWSMPFAIDLASMAGLGLVWAGGIWISRVGRGSFGQALGQQFVGDLQQPLDGWGFLIALEDLLVRIFLVDEIH